MFRYKDILFSTVKSLPFSAILKQLVCKVSETDHNLRRKEEQRQVTVLQLKLVGSNEILL